MGSPAIRLALAAGLPALLAGEALAQEPPAPLPSPAEVGQGLALANMCVDRDGYTDCDPFIPIGATFRQLLCVEYGADMEHHVIVRCVYRGARMEFRGGRRTTFRDYHDGAIDLVHIGADWLPREN